MAAVPPDRLFVIVATVGRADLTRRTVDRLADQTRPPDGILVVGTTEADVAGVAAARGAPEVLLAEKGSCRQRNHGLDRLAGRADIVLFLDDDFVPAATYCAELRRLFAEAPDVVGITGELIADGIHEGGFDFDEACRLAAERATAMPVAERPRHALYGCNMAVRLAAAEDLRFDEALPLYAWLEDIDYSGRLARRGRLISTGRVTGVHMGNKGGRTSGLRLGYSQVANVIYLHRKGTLQPRLGPRLLRQQLLSNLIRSVRPEPHIDRRGRLRGNLMAIGDWLRGRVDPARILSM